MAWQSPIAPGVSWYQVDADLRREFPPLDGSRHSDVAIIGGGFTGLQAAYTLARAGVSVTLIEAHRCGDGASGRNGGQFGSGQRWSPEETEPTLGFERSKALFDMAESAKAYVLGFAAAHGIDMDFIPGQMNVAHKPGLEAEYRRHADAYARYGYAHTTFMGRQETAERLGSHHYHCGIRDTGTGHIQPLKLVAGLARVTDEAGAAIFERTRATAIRSQAGRVEIETASGTITAKHALIATNAYVDGLEPVTAAHIMPIRSFIGATVPLDDFPEVIPGHEAVADSRFVVRYFRKSKDNRLLFGGREAYTADHPTDISSHISRQIVEIYPSLKNVTISQAWGGSVGITLSRQPFVREVMPGVVSIGGYSGHGVMLSNYCGHLYGQAVLGKSTDLDLVRDLNIRAFPGGTALRAPLLFLALSWFALRDRF